ncbi:putative cytochrome b561/ferric reductase transmembrane [Helianthus annuus]|uniref:Cytochrome b561/ferric reductase transmembrane n=1 Tax=Helianthus annuus TaxID=4232 RepID=A0A251VG70_HELAN|nr:cytochrome b561 domain-containing protein At4g18260 isoform X2 [Helianthus annuus]KAF5822252.1 putative cytochrome b561/ferric reductase transmembrane [Helianthus annuus]KAJ0622938.1 putative cytochrome b561/ferric reductase transmembrane [Helianthus annuus]KAJ0627118.1 putative cytochrome b561/ferric reductase transmembrane [Helianthus annuus]KAJ0783431.1 putative cytochrome b561/ferric reductase transmembrane [Helianthus annuus]KAJ0948228.1 putative cytochrome b561/ferric reductase transm
MITMHEFKKVFLSSMPASIVALYLLPLGVCSSNENHLIIPHKFIKQDFDQHKMNSRLIFDIKLHGILLWASMGFLMPLGVIIIRTVNKEECSPRKLKAVIYIHAILQVLGVLLACAGAILSVMSFENSFNNTHQKIGLALYAAILLQMLVGFCRPNRGTNRRTVWYVFHWIFGTMISLVGILNTYTGLKAYHKRTSMNARLWSILFTVEVSFMAFFYLFQEKWDYIYMQKQGGTKVDEPVMVICSDEVDNQKEVLSRQSSKNSQSSRNSNSLGNYFAKSNALKKLFQVT